MEYKSGHTTLPIQLARETVFRITAIQSCVMPNLFLLELACLSPDFSNVTNRPQVTIEENEGYYIISWTLEIAWYPNCRDQVSSQAPLQYNIYVINTDGVVVLQKVIFGVLTMCGWWVNFTVNSPPTGSERESTDRASF